MKRILTVVALLMAFVAGAQNIEKQTFVYAVKDADTLRLDRYALVGDTRQDRPCLMFVFGGGFVAGTRDAEQYRPYFDYYAQRGYVVVSIDYRLGFKKALDAGTFSEAAAPMIFIGTLTMAVEDLYSATDYLLDNAAKWGIDPAKIVTSGSSAGAITVLMGEYGLCNGSALASRLAAKSFHYAGVISYAGAIFDMGEGLQWRRPPAPILLFHGDADRNVPYGAIREQGAGFFGSKYIAEQLTQKHIPHWFYSVSNTDHVMATRPMTDNRYEIDTFLEKFVQQRQQLVIDTFVTPLDAPELPKVFTLSDYIRSNFGG